MANQINCVLCVTGGNLFCIYNCVCVYVCMLCGCGTFRSDVHRSGETLYTYWYAVGSVAAKSNAQTRPTTKANDAPHEVSVCCLRLFVRVMRMNKWVSEWVYCHLSNSISCGSSVKILIRLHLFDDDCFPCSKMFSHYLPQQIWQNDFQSKNELYTRRLCI